MKKSYQISTIASVQKVQPEPLSLREKVQKLSAQLLYLQSSLKNEDSVIGNLEKINSQQFSNLNSQVHELRKAFGTLADVVMDELDALKQQLSQESQSQEQQARIQLQRLEDRLLHVETQVQEQSLSVNKREQELRQRKETIKAKTEEQAVALGQQIDEQRVILDKLRIMIVNDGQRIDLLSKDKSTLQSQLLEVRQRIEETLAVTPQQGQDIEQLKTAIEDVARLTEHGTRISEELQAQFKREQLQNNRKLKEELDGMLENFKQQLNKNETPAEQRQQALEAQQQEFEKGLQDLAQLLKESHQHVIREVKLQLQEGNQQLSVYHKQLLNLQGHFNESNQTLRRQAEELQYEQKRNYYELLKYYQELSLQNKR